MIPDEQLLRLIFKWRVDAANLERSDDQCIRDIGAARSNDAHELELLLIEQAQGIQ